MKLLRQAYRVFLVLFLPSDRLREMDYETGLHQQEVTQCQHQKTQSTLNQY